MKFPTNFGLVMLTLGFILISTPLAECAAFGLKVNLRNPFSKQPSKRTKTSETPAQSPAAGLAPVEAPAPSPFSYPWTPSGSGLVVGFYNDKCDSNVEVIIEFLVEEEFKKDPTILPALLRLQFHDCFVHGCDASILVDGPSTEKTAEANLSVRGYEFIERLKAALDSECPGVVSCADIIAVATKVLIKLGGGLDYPVETGRKDGLVSNAADVQLPNPSMTVDEAAAVFAAKNFTLEEMVVLLGYHAVGIAHCNFFQDRLYVGTAQFDSEMDPSLVRQLKQTCPQSPITNNTASLNQDSTNNNTLNNRFYGELLGNRGLLAVDQALSRDPASATIVTKLSQNRALFDIRTAQVMIKLQAVEVLIGDQGGIRKTCGNVN